MKKVYILNTKFIGKVVFDSRGKHILTDKMTQKALKELYLTGHTEKITEIEQAKKSNSSRSKPSSDKGK